MTVQLGVQAAIVDGVVVPGDVSIDTAEGTIAAVGVQPAGAHGLAAPGFIDMQVNGFAGVDFTDADLDGYAEAGRAMATSGVTSYQPTLISLPEATYVAALESLAIAHGKGPTLPGPRILGAHLEGPFLSRKRAGAHDPGNIVEPDLGLADRLLDAGPVRHMTVAPERPGGLELVSHLVRRGVVVAVGHSDADAATGHEAFAQGARAVTHLFNALRPFHHREPGVGVAALVHHGVVVTLIVDGVHLAPDAVLLATRAARGRYALITDAIAAAGRGDGTFRVGDRNAEVRGTEVRLDDGTLAGSVLTMDQAVRNLVELGIDLVEAIGAATSVPAAVVGRPELGTLAPGTPADVVVLDDGYAVNRSIVGGREVHAT
jgi:N-acetylglucosamine-6-phosphate deacetylase